MLGRLMTDGHLTPDRASQIVEENFLDAQDLEHVMHCAFCHSWLRAFTALASNAGKTIDFELPPAPDSD